MLVGEADAFTVFFTRIVFTIHSKKLIDLASVAEPETVKPKLFEIRSRNHLLNKYLLKSVWRMLG